MNPYSGASFYNRLPPVGQLDSRFLAYLIGRDGDLVTLSARRDFNASLGAVEHIRQSEDRLQRLSLLAADSGKRTSPYRSP